MKKLLAIVLTLCTLASVCVFTASAADDFVEAFYPGKKIGAPAEAPYITYQSTYDDGTYHDSFIHIYYDVPTDFCRMAEEADRLGWDAFLEKYGLYDVRGTLQVDAKFDDGEWLSTTGNWDLFEYSEEIGSSNLAFYLRYTLGCDDSSKTGSYEQSWLVYCDDAERNDFLRPYIKTEKNEYGDDVLVYDFDNHTITYRCRAVVSYRLADYDGEYDCPEGNVIVGDWSSEASIGKNGNQRELVRPTSTAAPILSDFAIDEDNEGINGASYFLEVPWSVADGERALIILEDAFQPYCIEAQVRLDGGEWTDFYTANASSLANGTRSLALGDYDITRETRIEIRAHFVCNHDKSITSPWSNIVGINRVVTEFFWGDVNDDGKVNSKDVALYLKWAAGYQVTMKEEAADVNCDGKMNSKDVALMLKYLAGWSVTLGPAKTEYKLNDGDNTVVEDMTFDGDVEISGNNAQINFINCRFNGKIINTASEYTRVVFLDGCTFSETSKAIVRSGVREGSIEYAIPKFILSSPVPVESEGIGGAYALGLFDITFNGKTYTKNDIAIVAKEDGTTESYDGTQAIEGYLVAQWWESDTLTVIVCGE